MWFIFPQFKGLGFSETANYFSIQSFEEAEEYLNDSILGTRLKQITKVLIESNQINEDNLFTLVLDKYFNGELVSNTLNLIIK